MLATNWLQIYVLIVRFAYAILHAHLGDSASCTSLIVYFTD